MTTTIKTLADLDEIIRPALDAWSAEWDRHNGGTTIVQIGDSLVGECSCGWRSKFYSRGSHGVGAGAAGWARRSVGLHRTAAIKRADKVCNVESARLIAEATS